MSDGVQHAYKSHSSDTHLWRAHNKLRCAAQLSSFVEFSSNSTQTWCEQQYTTQVELVDSSQISARYWHLQIRRQIESFNGILFFFSWGRQFSGFHSLMPIYRNSVTLGRLTPFAFKHIYLLLNEHRLHSSSRRILLQREECQLIGTVIILRNCKWLSCSTVMGRFSHHFTQNTVCNACECRLNIQMFHSKCFVFSLLK